MARHIDIENERETALQAAVEELSRGQPIALPTETVYGLAADATDPAAITRIYETKGRPQFNPLICHMADIAMAERYAVFDPVSRRLAEAFWPGPLTLVLPLKPASGIHSLATAGLDTVGIRVPQGFAGDLIRRFDKPLAAPSANSSGKISPTSAAHVEADLGKRINLILDGGAASVGVESTIVKVEDDGRVRLLRPGGIVTEEIERITGTQLERPEKASAAIEAPGMLASHYAPGAAVRLDATSVSSDEALIRFGGIAVEGQETARTVLDLSPSGDLAEAAANLFDYLKAADASGAATIAVTTIPAHGLGEAINDRLSRAAAPRG
ncbi:MULTISPECIES: L-threonylcarbamoyladenylate synthase [Agrobacterium]|uniref:L-threonylcarbamoyladenylate synthase n=1 Tax=Agrobacterium TaxID=357 RepID=UPI000DD352F2|nr:MULTISPECIES: L-threonylcarbamoyladenylate synthase [Agrobacterium]MBO9107738.1 threonylcarbamoyl-AMP synthase [Agrobacterium sp. S2/73]NTA14966.1 threonylcarbamoyl-AMP synthase [Agrobacterium tumefaciens]NTA79835.1 threonylcarbamoyl-AMP synthase [Agrobacterium tumefaciens]QXZ71652.1 threonylcarbamoyl-AMP synthase [Agrobacterium sp. S7/73]WCK71218.1 L-threonylcarbamoyladenylate synthase [Agrobacterium tumefaciens]